MEKLTSIRKITLLFVVVMIAGSNCDSKLGVVTPRRFPFATIGLLDDSSDQQGGEPEKNKGCREGTDGGVEETKGSTSNCGCCCYGLKKVTSTTISRPTIPPDGGPTKVANQPPQRECKPAADKHEFDVYLILGQQAQAPSVVTNIRTDAGTTSFDPGVLIDVDATQSRVATKENSTSDAGMSLLHFRSMDGVPPFIVVSLGAAEKTEKPAEKSVPAVTANQLWNDINNAYKTACSSWGEVKNSKTDHLFGYLRVVIIFMINLAWTVGQAWIGIYFGSAVFKSLKDSDLSQGINFISKLFNAKTNSKDSDQVRDESIDSPINEEVRSFFRVQAANMELSRRLGVFVPQASAQDLIDLMKKHEAEITPNDWRQVGKYLDFRGDKIKVQIGCMRTIKAVASYLFGCMFCVLSALLVIGVLISGQSFGRAMISIVAGIIFMRLAVFRFKYSNGCWTALRVNCVLTPKPPVPTVGVE